MKRLLFIIFLFCAISYASNAADTIIVHKDVRLDMLTEKQVSINKVTSRMTSNGLFKGYRLQVLNTRSRDDAFKIKTNLLENFPSEKVYILYQSPYFKVRVGNFVNRDDAEGLKRQLSYFIKQPVYVVEDGIEYIPGADEFQ
ncbi:MAG TPA: SPOR domain-containing protein [Parafilimonas sp.]|nr:SPOR domain-containing protein [Parafilimonas sp.]